MPLTPPGYPHPPVLRAEAPVRGKLPLLIERETWPGRIAWGALVLSLLLLFLLLSHQFHVPAHPGMDQNAYLVGARNLAEHSNTGFKPPDPYAFVGRMWVATSDGWYYPKYPFGYSLIASFVLKMGGREAVYWVNPILMTAGLLGVFLLARTLAGSFAGVLAMLILASSPVTLSLTNNPNSHASAFCFATWGMYLLIRWWQHGTFWRAAGAGVLLGYAVTIRYTEGLVAIPLLLVLLFNIQPGKGRSWGQAATLLACWAFPVFLCVVTSYSATGTVNSYALTNESTAFSIEHFKAHWEGMIRNLANQGLFLTLPLGLLGLMLLVGRSARLALVLALWCVMPVLVYTAYYWAPETLGIGNLRFVFTALPPLAIAAGWCLTRAMVPPARATFWGRWAVAAPAAIVLVAASGAYAINTGWNMLQMERNNASAVDQAARQVSDHLPSGSVIFAPREVCNHLQFAGQYVLYCTDDLDAQYIRTLANVDPDEPNGLQPKRAADFRAMFRSAYKSEDEFVRGLPGDLTKLTRKLSADAIADGKRVALINRASSTSTKSRFDARHNSTDSKSFELKTIATWTTPTSPPESMQLIETSVKK